MTIICHTGESRYPELFFPRFPIRSGMTVEGLDSRLRENDKK